MKIIKLYIKWQHFIDNNDLEMKGFIAKILGSRFMCF